MCSQKRKIIRLSDVIATLALIISVVATVFAYNANKRAEKLDNDAAAVAIQSIEGSIREVALYSRMAYLFLNGLNEHIKAHPEDSHAAKRLRLDAVLRDETPKLSISQDSILLISRIDANAAKKFKNALHFIPH